MTWPKGLPRRGWRESGLCYDDWAAKYGYFPTGIPGIYARKPVDGLAEIPAVKENVDAISGKEYCCIKDGFGRIFIVVCNALGERVGYEQVAPRQHECSDVFEQAERLGRL